MLPKTAPPAVTNSYWEIVTLLLTPIQKKIIFQKKHSLASQIPKLSLGFRHPKDLPASFICMCYHLKSKSKKTDKISDLTEF